MKRTKARCHVTESISFIVTSETVFQKIGPLIAKFVNFIVGLGIAAIFGTCRIIMVDYFDYKHTETIEYVKKLAYILIKIQTLRVNNWGNFAIKNAKFSWHYFHMN